MSDELYGIRINDDYLAHHGILGQKWGKKNGPPYPLDYKKLSPAEKQQAKADAIRRGDLDEVQLNRNEFSDDEVRAAIARFRLNSELSKVNEKHVKTGLEKFEDFTTNAKRVSDAVENGSKAWNTFAKVSNSLHLTKPKDLPIIDMRNPWEKTEKKMNGKKEEIFETINGKEVKTKTVETDKDGNIKTTLYDPYKATGKAREDVTYAWDEGKKEYVRIKTKYTSDDNSTKTYGPKDNIMTKSEEEFINDGTGNYTVNNAKYTYANGNVRSFVQDHPVASNEDMKRVISNLNKTKDLSPEEREEMINQILEDNKKYMK